MNLKNKFLLILCLGIFTQIYAEPFATQIITIFLNNDPSTEYDNKTTWTAEDYLGTISLELLVALTQEQSIIIVNDTLLSSLFYALYIYTDISQKDVEFSEIKLKAFEKNKQNILYIQNMANKFNPNNWIKKKLGTIYILIPKNYIAERMKHVTKLLKNNDININSVTYSLAELTTGIKHLQKNIVSDEDFENFIKTTKVPKVQKSKKFSQDFIIDFKKIWISKQEYYKTFNKVLNEHGLLQLIPQSVIVISGHGSAPEKDYSDKFTKIGGDIAGLTSDEFGKFVAFIKQSLTTKLLFFNTCYGSEVNVQKALESTAQELDQSLQSLWFEFPLISGAINTAPTYFFIKNVDFKKFSQELTEQEVPTSKKFIERGWSKEKNIIENVIIQAWPLENFILDALKNIYQISYNNIPIIRYKDLPWRMLDIPDTINIDEILTKTHEPGQPLDIETFFKGKRSIKSNYTAKIYPRIIAIKTSDIPFPLEISEKYSPLFISTIPGDSFQTISFINAPKVQLSSLLDSLVPSKDLKEYKIFNIKKITALNDYFELDVDNFQEPITITNIWRINGPNLNNILFFYNEKIWLSNVNNNYSYPHFDAPQKITKETLQGLQNKLQKIIKEIAETKQNSSFDALKKVIMKTSEKTSNNFLEEIHEENLLNN